MTRAAGEFRPEEVTVALEVFDTGLGIGRRKDPDYELVGAEIDGSLVGWACWGPTPCTVGTFDLYWIVVDRSCRGQGIGTVLMEEMERCTRGRARMIVVETAGRADYESTRTFYERRGYRAASRIADYYAVGDDLVTYVKRCEVRGPRREDTAHLTPRTSHLT